MINQEDKTSDLPRPDPLLLAYAMPEIAPWRQNLSRRFLRSYIGFWSFVGSHWLSILNGVNAICILAAVAAPLLLLAGWDGPANVLYGFFHLVCAQTPHHSFYIGDKQMCLCQRCMAIYGGMLGAGLLFQLGRGKLQPLKTWQFLLFFCPPMAIDAFTQMWGWRESSWELRFLTGGLFAIGAVWTLYPLLEAKMNLLRRWVRREVAETALS